MSIDLVSQFQQVYNTLNKDRIDSLDTIYSDNIHFVDPFHEINGLLSLKTYFSKLYHNVDRCHFIFGDICHSSNIAYIPWEMSLQHPKINKGHIIKVSGCTCIKFNEKIIYHRDYFDAGSMLYEYIPVLRNIITYVKGKL